MVSDCVLSICKALHHKLLLLILEIKFGVILVKDIDLSVDRLSLQEFYKILLKLYILYISTYRKYIYENIYENNRKYFEDKTLCFLL